MSLASLEAHGRGRGHDNHHAHGHALQRVSHQFEDIDQQNESYVVGMWTFLVTEIMFFGALFLAYSVYRVLYFQTYLSAHHFLDIKWGTLNTLVLLTSSLSMAFGVYHAQRGNRTGMIACLLFTILCSFAFLGIKSIEYTSKFREKLFPGAGFNYTYAIHEWEHEHPGETFDKSPLAQKAETHTVGGEREGTSATGGNEGPAATGEEAVSYGSSYFTETPKEGFNHVMTVQGEGYKSVLPTVTPQDRYDEVRGKRAQLFFSLYFAMTGLHAVHIILGIVMMSILVILAAVKHPSVDDYMPTEMVGLYWHFVDIVWIFLFPLMYLIS